MSLRMGVNSFPGGHDSCTHENSKRAGDELLSEYNTGRPATATHFQALRRPAMPWPVTAGTPPYRPLTYLASAPIGSQAGSTIGAVSSAA